MAKALVGAHVPPSSLRLLDEVRSLRQRVAELEQALEAAEAAREAAATRNEEPVGHVRATAEMGLDEREPATT